MKTFVLRSSDNALVWVKDMPEKPSDYIYQWGMNRYNEALAKAIENGIKVADEEEIIRLIGLKERGLADLEHYHVFKENDNYFIGTLGEKRNKINLRQVQAKFYFELNPGTPYQLDVEMEVNTQVKTISGSWVPSYGNVIPDCELENPVCEYRQLAYIKREGKEECERCGGTGLVTITIHTDSGDYDADDQPCPECQHQVVEPKEEPKPEAKEVPMRRIDHLQFDTSKDDKAEVTSMFINGEEWIKKVLSPEAESQEELWNELIKECGFYTDPPSVKLSKEAFKKFHITRKKSC